MITLSHNLGEVLAEVRALNDTWTLAVVDALDPAVWHPLFLESARRTLTALAAPEQQPLVDQFLSTFTMDRLAMGFTARLTATPRALARGREIVVRSRRHDKTVPKQPVVNPVSGKVEMRGRERGITDAGERAYMNELHDALRAWVAEEKHLDERDAGRTQEEIAGRLGLILFSGGRKPELQEARAALMKMGRSRGGRRLGQFVQDWMAAAFPGQQGSSAETRRWMEAVLLGWRALFRARIPFELKRGFDALHAKIQKKQRTLGI